MIYKGVFFDLYGTLLIYGDMAAAWADWLAMLYMGLADQGLKISKEELDQAIDGFFTQPEPPYQEDGLTIFERRLRVLGLELDLDLTKETLQQLANTSVDAWQKYVSVDPDTIHVLQTLRSNKKLALVSNFEHPAHVHSLLAESSLTKFFESIVVSGDIRVAKPDPRIFSPALQQTQLHPNEVIYVGDTLDDVHGACAAGLTPILIQRDGPNQSQVASDYRSNQQSSQNTPKTLTAEGVKVIHQLTELVEIAG